MTLRTVLTYVVVLLVFGSTFYAMILNPYEIDDLTKGFFIGASGSALQWVFGSATASSTARQQQTALNTPPPSC